MLGNGFMPSPQCQLSECLISSKFVSITTGLLDPRSCDGRRILLFRLRSKNLLISRWHNPLTSSHQDFSWFCPTFSFLLWSALLGSWDKTANMPIRCTYRGNFAMREIGICIFSGRFFLLRILSIMEVSEIEQHDWQ